MRLGLIACLVSCSLGACADQTGILVQITSTDIVVPADVDGLTIRAYTPDGLMVDRSFAIRSSWPQSLLIRPAQGEALGEVRVEVTGTLAGAFAVRRVVMTAFMPGQVRRVDVQLTRDCLGRMCAADVDCVAGACQGAPGDAGMPDAGHADAGSDAAAGDDAGDDAGADAGHDAGNDAAAPCAGASCAGHVVISEMSPSMSNEFVELYNRSGNTADVGGCALEYFSGGAWQSRGTIAPGTTLPAHGYYLMANAGYTGTVAPDAPALWASGFLDTSGAVRVSCSAVALDVFGYGASAQREGSPAPAVDWATTPAASYERKARADSTAATMAAGGRDATAGNGQDADDNLADFVVRATREPQSSASAREP